MSISPINFFYFIFEHESRLKAIQEKKVFQCLSIGYNWVFCLFGENFDLGKFFKSRIRIDFLPLKLPQGTVKRFDKKQIFLWQI